MQIEGLAAVVVGGASGLGAATARALADAGARVTILDRDPGAAASVAAGFGGIGLGCDVRDESRVIEALAKARVEHGSARVLVNCAGVANPANTLRRDGPLSAAAFREVIEINLVGTFICLAQAGQAMRELDPLSTGERGVIINTASIAAFDGQVGQAAYSASKGGVAAMTLPIAREIGRHGIRVVAIAPGVFRTPMTEGLPEIARKIVFSHKPPFPERPGHPDEFAQLVLSIVANPMLNGTVIRLDGGLRMPPRD